MPFSPEDAEASARAAEALRSAILETALDAVITIDHDGRVEDFNPVAEEIFGWSREEALGREMAELIVPPELRDRHRLGLRRAVETGENRLTGRRLEIVGLRRNGEKFPCELAITRLTAPGVRPPRFIGQIRDIAPRRQAEARQAVQFGVARILAESASLAVATPLLLPLMCETMGWEAGTFWRVETASTVLRALGVWPGLEAPATTAGAASFAPGAGLPGQVWATGEAAETPAPAPYAFAFPVRLGREVLGVLEFQAGVGSRLTPEVTGMLQGVGSQLGQFIERREAEEGVRRLNAELTERIAHTMREAASSQELFYKAFHSNPAAMTLSKLPEGRFVDVNAAFMRGTEHTREETIGRTSDELGVWIEGPAREEFFQTLAQYGTIQDREITFYSGTGRRDHVLLSAEVIEWKGEPHLLTVAIDINARRKAEAELRQALAQEKELSELKSSFVTLVSHEFRTPLGIIMSAADILAAYFDRLTPERREEHLGHIHEASRRMAELMEEVLLLGKVEAGKIEFKPLPFQPAAWSQRLADEMLSATNRRCEIELQIAPEAESEAMADEALLRHIFTNLLSNGVKYSPAGSRVLFRLGRSEGDAVFEVCDSGIGIPVEDRGQLFEAFHRGRNVGEVTGSGLGLTIVKRCVDLHGGRILIEDAPGGGTLVRVHLPLFSGGRK